MISALDSKYQIKIKEVEYEYTKVIKENANNIENDLKQDFDLDKAMDLLLWKRTAFMHEREVRVLLYSKDDDLTYQPKKPIPIKDKLIYQPQKRIPIKINGHALIESIRIDPRVPHHIGEAMIRYLKNKIKFKNRVRKSGLYTLRDDETQSVSEVNPEI